MATSDAKETFAFFDFDTFNCKSSKKYQEKKSKNQQFVLKFDNFLLYRTVSFTYFSAFLPKSSQNQND